MNASAWSSSPSSPPASSPSRFTCRSLASLQRYLPVTLLVLGTWYAGASVEAELVLSSLRRNTPLRTEHVAAVMREAIGIYPYEPHLRNAKALVDELERRRQAAKRAPR